MLGGVGATLKRPLAVWFASQGGIGAGKQETTFMAIDENTLTKGQLRKLNALGLQVLVQVGLRNIGRSQDWFGVKVRR